MKILHVPFCYYPDPVGGTEVYVAALARHLRECGHEAIVAAPAPANATYEHDGIRVQRYAVSAGVRTVDEIYGAGDESGAVEFDRVLDREAPDVVHLHALTAGVSLRMLRAAQRRGLPVVFTYHTPTASCVRGTLMRWGSEFCDGRLRPYLCTCCTLQSLGLNQPAAMVVGGMPAGVGRWIGRRHWSGRVWTALRMREFVGERQSVFQAVLAEADQLVAVCNWGREILVRNGAESAKLIVSRHGLAHAVTTPLPVRAPSADLRVAFFGRLHPTKGVQVLIDAFRHAPQMRARLEIFGVAQDEAGRAYEAKVRELAKTDARIMFRPPIPSAEVVATLAHFDVLAVPSQWVETGPLVALEAFAAGIPVIGWNIGGTAELIQHEVNGLLVPLPDVGGWVQSLERLATDRKFLERLQQGVTPPRQAQDVAVEMAAIYQRLVS